MKVIQVGAYPPPFGGVTVHLQRLHDHLLARGRDSVLYDLSGVPKSAAGVIPMAWAEALAALRVEPRAIVHLHNFDPHLAGDFFRLSRRHVVVLSLHNERFPDEIEALGAVRAGIARFLLRRLHGLVVDSRRCAAMARAIFGHRIDVRLIPEFIPPASVPPLDHPEIVALRERHRVLIASNAWTIAFHRGEDLYGLDLLVDALRGLHRDRGLDAALVVLLPSVGDPAYLAELRNRCRSGGIAARVLFVTEPLAESASLWRAADVVVRATNTDGNSLSVAEALSLGTPVVASDCAERPEGAVLFRTRDARHLEETLAGVLADIPAARAAARPLAASGHVDAFVSLYDDLAGRWVAHAA